jgi:alginate O-acetyltransferase complex protein AlgI
VNSFSVRRERSNNLSARKIRADRDGSIRGATMLFNSYVFIFAFLPLALAVFYLLAGVRNTYARWWLAATSFYFYAYWDLSFLPLLIGSIFFNYLAGRAIEWVKMTQPMWRTTTLVIAVACNLLLLGYFKYSAFLLNTAEHMFGLPGQVGPISIIPLGISFFTFTQIAYLADVTYLNRAERSPVTYALFVNFFPHLIAGPILHHRETIPQFAFTSIQQTALENMAIGITIFSFGLFKKVVLADGIAPFVTLAFSAQTAPGLLDAWTGVLAYTVQIYFDFSGYSDMAIGLARMFGIIFPLNFNSPYQAANIIDFWRRWHMTLSRFLRDYVYIPIGGNRSGMGQYTNILITMFIGGLWHGAGWTFVIWGLLHGLYLTLNHLYRRVRKVGSDAPSQWRRAVGRGSTFLAVVLAWVFFRSSGIEEAGTILFGMVGLNGLASTGELACTPAKQTACLLGVPVAWCWIAALLGIVFFAPHTQQVMWRWKPALDDVRAAQMQTRIAFKPTLRWAFAIAVLFAIAVARLSEHSQFLYYQF